MMKRIWASENKGQNKGQNKGLARDIDVEIEIANAKDAISIGL